MTCSSTSDRPVLNIDINQNASFLMTLQLTDTSGSAVNITSWAFSGSLRDTYDGGTSLPIMYFTASVTDVTQSIVTYTLTPYQTRQLTGSLYYYDMTATNYNASPDEVYRLLEGKARIRFGMTNPSLTDL